MAWCVDTTDDVSPAAEHRTQVTQWAATQAEGELLDAPLAVPLTTTAAPSSAGIASPTGNVCGCHDGAGSSCGRRCRRSQGWCSRAEEKWHTQTKPCLQARYWGYPEYFCERRFGVLNSQAAQMMIVNGIRDQMVLYHYDFGFGTDAERLKDRGRYQLQKMIKRFHIAGSPLIIQASDDPQLDAQRQASVLAALADLGMQLEPEMVVVGRPGVPGMSGDDAVRAHTNLLFQAQLRGNVGIETSAGRQVGLGSNAGGAAAPARQ